MSAADTAAAAAAAAATIGRDGEQPLAYDKYSEAEVQVMWDELAAPPQGQVSTTASDAATPAGATSSDAAADAAATTAVAHTQRASDAAAAADKDFVPPGVVGDGGGDAADVAATRARARSFASVILKKMSLHDLDARVAVMQAESVAAALGGGRGACALPEANGVGRGQQQTMTSRGALTEYRRNNQNHHSPSTHSRHASPSTMNRTLLREAAACGPRGTGLLWNLCRPSDGRVGAEWCVRHSSAARVSPETSRSSRRACWPSMGGPDASAPNDYSTISRARFVCPLAYTRDKHTPHMHTRRPKVPRGNRARAHCAPCVRSPRRCGSQRTCAPVRRSCRAHHRLVRAVCRRAC